jgi:hypothetical protein
VTEKITKETLDAAEKKHDEIVRLWRDGHTKLSKLTSLAGLAARGEHAARRVVEAYKLQGPPDRSSPRLGKQASP